MKNFFKNLTAIVASLSLMVTAIPNIFAEETTAETKAPAIISEGQEEFLRYMEIIPSSENEIDYDRELTRGEMAHMAATVANLGEYQSDELYFYDVPVDYTYFNDIYSLREMGVISGDGDGFFRPDDPVTSVEISKIFSILLGYRAIGEVSSYLRTARDSGLIRGVSFDGNVTYGQGLLIAYNTLHCKMMEMDTFGDTTSYKVNENLTAIERYWGLVPQKGIVEGIFGTTLVQQDDGIEENTMVIDGHSFTYEGHDDLLGYQVMYYVPRTNRQHSTIDDEIQFACKHDDNRVIVISKEDILNKDTNYIYYMSGERKKKAKIDAWTDAVFNGMAKTGYTLEDLTSDNGTVTLIDNDDDDIIDVIVEESYQYMKVIDNDSQNGILTGYKYAKDSKTKVTVGSRERDMSVKYLQRGEEVRANKVKNNAIVAVKQSRNTEGIWKVWIEILSDTATGIVECISDDSVKVAGTEYPISDTVVTDDVIRSGDTVKVYGHRGSCALLIHATSEDYLVGMLVDASATNKNGFDDVLNLKIVNTSRQMEVYKGIEKVYVDGVRYTDDIKKVLDCLSSSAQMCGSYNSMYPYSQLIRYCLNDSGQVTRIDTVNKLEGEDDNSLELSVSKVRATGVTASKSLFNSSGDKEYLFSVDSKTATFGVPDNARDELNWYANIAMNDSETFYVEGYNVDPDTNIAKYWIYYVGKWNTFGTAQVPAIVSDIRVVLDEDDNPVNRITAKGADGASINIDLEDEVYWGESGNELYTQDQIISSLKIGDVIDYRMDNTNKKAIRIFKLFSPGDKTIAGHTDRVYSKGSGTTNHEVRQAVYAALGTMYSSTNQSMLFHTTSIPGDEYVDFTDKNTLKKYYPFTKVGVTYYLYDSSTPARGVTVGSLNDLVSYEENNTNPNIVFVAAKQGTLKYVYIMK